MERFKIEDFEAEYRNEHFPWYEELSPEEAHLIQIDVARKLGLSRELISDLELLQEVEKKAIKIPNINANDEGFDLIALTKKLNLCSQDKVLLNWLRFDKIDRMNLADLSKYFDDIWYGVADDLDVFDESLKWILLIDHDGFIKLLRFHDINS